MTRVVTLSGYVSSVRLIDGELWLHSYLSPALSALGESIIIAAISHKQISRLIDNRLIFAGLFRLG